MPELYNQQTISLLDSQTSNLPSGIISSDPKLTENVLGLVQNVPLPSVSEVLTIDQKQELDKPEHSAELLAIEPDSQPSKSYSSSLSETEQITSFDGMTDDDLLIGKVENREPQGLLGGEPGDTVIGTAGSDSSVKLSPEDTLLNNAEVTSIKTEENQQLGGEFSQAENLQKPQAEEINSPVLLEENVELSQTTNVIPLSTAAPEDNSQKVQGETSIPVTSSVVEEEKKTSLQPEEIVAINSTETLENKSHAEQQQIPSESNQQSSEIELLPTKEENLLGVEEGIDQPLISELPELDASSEPSENLLSKNQYLPATTANDINEVTANEQHPTPLNFTESETKNKPIENISNAAIAVEETPSLTTKASETTTTKELIPNSTGDELSETKEQLVTSSNQADDTKPTAQIASQLNSQESSEEVANKQLDIETLTSSNSSVKADSEDTIVPSIPTVKPEEVEAFKSGVFTVGSSGEVGIDFLYDGGWYQGQLAIFSLEGMEKYQPGSPEFIKEAALRAASNSELGYIAIDDVAEGARFIGALGETNHNSGEYKEVKSFKLRPESSFSIMLIPNNRVEEVAENPMVSGSARPLFSMTTANPNEAFHVGQIADVTGEGNTFVMEDMRADEWTDRDYNDLIFQVRGAIGQAALMDEVVAPEKDWRGADLGKALIAYAKAYINPDFLETSDPVDPESGNQENIGEPNSNNEEIVGEIPPRSPLSDSNNTDSIPSEKTETVSPKIPPDQLLSIADAKQLIESFDIMRSLGQEIPQKLLELAEKSLANNQPFSPEVPATLSNPTDILTGEIIPTIPVASIPKLEILAPESNQGTQPLIGAIAPSDNQPQNWASALVEFINTAVKSGPQNAVVNLNIDLTKSQNSGNDTGTTSLTIEEKAALLYARENKVLVIVPVGDTPGKISPLAEASKEFNNIITVGAAERVNDSVAISKGFAASPNSGSGSSLDIVAEVSNDNSSSTTVASAKVTDTIAQVWAVNPQLNYTQIIDIVKRTATDLGQPNWDNLTGAGIANTEAAVWLAKATEAQPISSVTAPGTLPKTAPITVQPFADVTLTPGQPSTNIDLGQIFAGNSLTYEIIGGSSDSVNLKLTGGQLQLTGLARSGVKDVTIRAIDATGKSADTKFSVTNYYLEQSSVAALNNALTDLTSAIANNPEGLIAALSSDETETALNILTGTLEKNPQLIQLLANPETLKNFGLDSNKVDTIQQLLQSPELAAQFGLNVPLGEALSNPDSTLLDSFLLNADQAVYLLPENAKQPKVGFIDFSQGNHIQQVTSTFASINSLANYDTFNVAGGNWASQLVKFVDSVKSGGEKHAIANLSLDLSQLDDIGITTRYELTPEEQQAIQYARENNVLLVVASGNTGGVMSALGQASKQFDNIITVGAVNQFESKTDYSAYGDGLTLMAPGGSWHDDPNAFVGTSRATSYVTAAASLIWAANPNLSFQQVKQLLIDTAADLDVPGWDALTGAGLVNIKEAIDRAFFMEGKWATTGGLPLQVNPFSGEGRVETLARPTSEETEKAIALLQNIQESLLEQWQTLADLGNPALTLADLDAEVKQKIAAALDEYQQVSTDAGITTAQAQQWAEALVLATQHYQIEKARLQTLLEQQKELQDQLAALGQQKSALETETQQMLADIQKQIGIAESDLAKAQAKLTNPFADVDDNLQINPQPWQNAANNEQQSASNFLQQSNVQNVAAENYNSAANSINPTRWQVVGSASRPSGRTQEIWGPGNDPNLLRQKTQLQLQAQISSQNVQAFQQLAQQAEQQNTALTQYAQFLNDQQNLNLGNGNTNDANTVLELLKEQLSDQENIANNYQKLASLAEARRVQNQSSADWNNSQINRWQQVGTRRTGRSGSNTEPVYGWVHYPEYIAPRDQAQQLANQAAQERDVYQQLASQSQQQVTALQEQVRKLSERVQDWPVLQQGIKYEITADELRLQAEKDLLALHTPVQQQKLETLNLQISQAEEQLQTLENQKLPTQQQATDLTENRLKETQTELEAIQTKRADAQKDLQNFLETAGFLLPYRERLAAVQKTVEQLASEKLDVQKTMQQLSNQIIQTPSDSLRQQLNYWNDHLATLNQELDWAKLQQDQLALAIADSPERLAISGLIKELEGATTGGLPLERYLDFLHSVEGSGANFLEGFDNLVQRLAAAKAEESQTQKDLDRLNREYRELGLHKANLEDNLIPAKEGEIAAKEQQIAGTESATAQTQGTLNNLENQLTQTQDSLAKKSAEIQQQEEVIASTQSQLTNLQNQLVAKNYEIQQQQSVAQGYQNQINQANAAVNSLEQQRQQHQANADYWNGKIWTVGVVGYQSKLWLQIPVYGSIYNPQAEANRNAEQAAANSYAQQRDTAQANAQQVTATLQPQIAVNQQQIATLQQQQQSLAQQQQALNSQLASQQTQLQQLQKEQQAITQQANNLQSQVDQIQNQLNGLNTQLGNQQQQREDLIAKLAQLNQQKSDIEQKLIEKYREIELTDQYLEQVEAEVNRLQSRLDLLNKAGVLEQKYQQNWQSWQEATQAQTTATQAVLEIRKAGQPDRDRLAFLQQQFKDTQANLDRAKSIEKSITDTQQSLEFTKLQLGNQTLLLQSLIDRDNPLASAERYYLNDAEAHRQKTWYWNGSSYIYNSAEAEAYRASLQQASFVADQRNLLWQQRQETLEKINQLNQKISQQQSDIATKQSELASLGQTIPQIESQIITIQGEINTVTKRLEPLQVQENKQTQIIQAATTKAQNLVAELSQTTELHSTALRQLIGFGILASESDVDFFATQVEPQVNTHLAQLKTVGNDLGNQIDSQNQQIANWEQELANTQDDVSKQALTNMIEQAKTQLGNLQALKASNQTNADELEDLLKQATEALTPLRQKQELKIRQKLESNDGRLESLQSQLNSENAADAAIKSGTVLDHVLLVDQINQDLRLGVTNWTEQFLAGNQQTKELVTQQQELSNSVDELIAYINDNLAEPDGNYNRTHTDLANAITTLGVVENRADELDTAFTSTEDAIEKIKLRIEQDAKLWEEIAPIAIRYGAESQQLAEFTNLAQKLQAAKEKFDKKQPDAIAFATQEVLPIAESLIDRANGNPALATYVEKVQELLAKFNDLAAKQAASEAKATEIRQEWEDATNYDDTPINQINFGNKLVESRRGQDNLVYVRNSTDGGKTWTQWLNTGGGTNFDSIKTAVVDNKLFQSIRGTDNQIWGRSSTDGVNWGSWFPIGGAMTTDYSMDVVGKNLVFTVRNSDNKIYSRTAVNGTQWQNWESLGSTMSDIVQDVVDGKLIQSYRGFDNQIYVRQSVDGVKWENWEKIDAAIAKSDWREEYLQDIQQSDTHNLNTVTRTQYKDKLVEAVRGKDNLMYSRSSTDGGKTWSNWQYTNISINSDVQMVVANNALVQVARGTDNILYFRQSNDGVNWISWTPITGAISDDFSIDAIDNKVVFSVQGSDKKLYSRTLIPNVSWTNWEGSPLTTINPIEQKLVDGKIVQSYKGVDDRTYVRYSTDGLKWNNWETLESAIAKAEINQQYLGELQQNSDQNPNPVTRTQYKDKLVEAVRGKDNLMYGRSSTDGGKTWSNWQYTNISINSDVQMIVANNALVQVARGTDNTLYFRQSNDGVNWINWTQLTGTISDDFSIDAVDNKVVFSVRGSDNNFYSRTLIPNVRWTNWEPSQVKTIDGISQEVVDGKVVQTYQGVDGQIYTRSTADGLTWSAWENQDAIAKQYQQEKESQLPLLTQETSLAARPLFLADNSENATAIDILKAVTLEGNTSHQEISSLLNNPSADALLNAEAVEGRNPNQSLFDKAKAEQASHEAQGYALLAQAAWYEQQAAYNWAVSRKNGPYWYEQRWVKGRSGRGHTETITHVDYNWILWQQYSQLFPQLRAQGQAQLVEADKWRKEKERIEPLKNQWVAANDAANQAEPPIDEARNFFAELEAARESIPGDRVQLATLENLLPTLKEQLEQAEAEAAAQNAKVQQKWEEYDTNSEEYRAAIADILQRRGELNIKAIETQQQLAEAEGTVERQTVALSDELASTKALTTQLDQQRQSINNQILELVKQGVLAEDLDDLNTNLVQINQSLKLLNNKAAVLTAEQTALTQKRTMLTAQNEVILAEQRLLDAYINDPDADYSNLQQQLDDARAALAEAQRLAEQAEAASQALTASLQQLKTDLLAQNDEHLKAAKEHQTILKDLVEATQSNANYTLQAAQKQQTLNNLEFQIIQRLQQATAAGNQEAKALLDVAQRNDLATAAELYYRDYKDLASDRGGCAGGAGNANDQILADRYYVEMLNNRELQRRAQAQADAFGAARKTAEAQMKTLQTQQETAAQLLNDLNAKVAETQAERENKEQELAIAQARLDGITRIREQTEQTFIQLVTLEKLNLAQAQLEQEIAQSHQAEIDEAVQERMERDRLELERKRLETTAKIEQLKQLQAEDDLRQSLNNVRGDLGLATLDPTEDPMQLQTQLAGLLTSLKDLESQQPDLPDDVKALLAEARGDIHLALQGKEAANIQESLLSAMDGMIGQIESYKSEINRIDLEEQWDNQLLQTAQTDLQGASQQFLEELQRAEELSGEKQIINPLYEEVLNKIALAEQAVEISSDLAKQGKEMLDQIIEQRIAERKARKKAFWNKILGIISQVAGILSTVLMILSPAFPALIPFSIGLGAVSGAINTIQAVINGDWMGAIFSGVMTGLSAVTGGMTQALGESAKAVVMMKTLQAVVSGAFNGARSLMSGESIMGFLQILGSVASAASAGMSSFINQCSAPLQKVMLSVVQSLQQAPQMIYSGIQSIQSGDWLNAIGNFFNGALAIGQSFAGNFNTAVAGILENISKVGNTALYLGNAIKNGGIEGWLSGLNGILGLWKNDLMGMVDKIKDKDKPSYIKVFSEVDISEDENQVNKTVEYLTDSIISSESDFISNDFSDLLNLESEITALPESKLLVHQRGATCAVASQNLILKRFLYEDVDSLSLDYSIDKFLNIGTQESEEMLMQEAKFKGYYAEGTADGEVGRLLNDYGIPVTQVKDPTMSDLKSALAQGKMVIVTVDSNKVPHPNWQMSWLRTLAKAENFNKAITATASHAVVVAGFNPTNKTLVIADSGIGKVYEIPEKTFEDVWHYSVEPVMVKTNYSPKEWRLIRAEGNNPSNDRPSIWNLDLSTINRDKKLWQYDNYIYRR